MTTSTRKNETVGIFYELPNRSIVKTFGFNAQAEEVCYYADGMPRQTVSYDEFDTWKPRNDLSDFPHAKDPLLPRVFDLYHDIKRMSELRDLVEELRTRLSHLETLMRKHNISLEE